jgi:hypothetical protein
MPPPSILDPLANVGYLIAAVSVTVVGLIGYAVGLRRRLGEAAQQQRELKRRP